MLSDKKRLDAVAVRTAVRRRVVVAIAAGIIAGVLAGMRVDPGRPETMWIGLGASLLVCAIVFMVTSMGFISAARRELEAVTNDDRLRHKRMRKAIVRARTHALGETDRGFVARWAAAAEPLYFFQMLYQVALVVVIIGGATATLIGNPGSVLQRWVVGAMLLGMPVTLFFDGVRPWLRVREVAEPERGRVPNTD